MSLCDFSADLDLLLLLFEALSPVLSLILDSRRSFPLAATECTLNNQPVTKTRACGKRVYTVIPSLETPVDSVPASLGLTSDRSTVLRPDDPISGG
eukprot:76557-Hanusia_phi.AAC.1